MPSMSQESWQIKQTSGQTPQVHLANEPRQVAPGCAWLLRIGKWCFGTAQAKLFGYRLQPFKEAILFSQLFLLYNMFGSKYSIFNLVWKKFPKGFIRDSLVQNQTSKITKNPNINTSVSLSFFYGTLRKPVIWNTLEKGPDVITINMQFIIFPLWMEERGLGWSGAMRG